jgi:hypothetical protein
MSATVNMGEIYTLLLKQKFVVHMKLVRLIKMHLKETYNEVHIGKHLSDNFPIQNGLKQGYALFITTCFSTLL